MELLSPGGPDRDSFLFSFLFFLYSTASTPEDYSFSKSCIPAAKGGQLIDEQTCARPGLQGAKVMDRRPKAGKVPQAGGEQGEQGSRATNEEVVPVEGKGTIVRGRKKEREEYTSATWLQTTCSSIISSQTRVGDCRIWDWHIEERPARRIACLTVTDMASCMFLASSSGVDCHCACHPFANQSIHPSINQSINSVHPSIRQTSAMEPTE